MVEATRTLLAVNLAESLQYRGSALMWTISGFLSQLMALSLWSAVAAERGGEVGGYSHGDLVTYFVYTQLVVVIAASWASWKMSMGIRNGTMSAELLRPMPPWVGWFCEIFAFKVVMLLIQVPALLVVSMAFGASLPDGGMTILLAPIAIVGTLILRFTTEICIGAACFWLTDNRGIAGTFFLAYLLLSGGFAPVALMPPAFRTVAENSPFYYMLGFPVDLLTGRLTALETATGFALQIGWLAIALALATVLWKRGLRRYSAVGA